MRSTAMHQSQMATIHANRRVQGVKSTPMPATISMMPTKSMNAVGLIGIKLRKVGDRYFSQATSRLKNLSSPATIGTRPKTMRNVHHTDRSRLVGERDGEDLRGPCQALAQE